MSFLFSFFCSPQVPLLLPLLLLGSKFFYFFKIFLVLTIFKVFIEFATILFLFSVLVFLLLGMWDFGSPQPCIGRQSLNH